MRPTQEQIDRFWSKVDIKSEDECWEWTAGTKNKEGYGGFYLKQINNTVNCHKLAFCIVHNFDWEDIPDSIVIRHTCNNYPCVNPKHLKLGTFKDNSQDMIEAGNSMYGTKNAKSKLTLEQVKELRELWNTGKYTHMQLADIFNIGYSNAQKIALNLSYKDPDYTPLSFDHSRKITKEDVIKIREMKIRGVPVKEIMFKFNIGQTQVYNIINKRQWTDV